MKKCFLIILILLAGNVAYAKYPPPEDCKVTGQGTSGNPYKIGDGTGTFSIGTLAATGGTIDGAVIGGSTPAAGSFTTIGATGAVTLNGNVTIGNATGDALTFHPGAWTLSNAVTITGTWANIGTITTADINGGTIDSAVIGGSTPAAGSFTTIDATDELTLAPTGDTAGYLKFYEADATSPDYIGWIGANARADISVLLRLPEADPAGSVLSFATKDGGTNISEGTWVAVSTLATLTGTQTLTNKIIDSTVSIQTADYAVLAADMGKVFTNEGDAGTAIFTLPEASTVVGQTVTFVVMAAQVLNVNPNDGTDKIENVTNAAGDSYQADAVGETLTLLAVANNAWVVLSSIGTWSDAD